MPNPAAYRIIKNIRRQLLLLASGVAEIEDEDKRLKYGEILQEILDTDLLELGDLVNAK